jgi:hypothetical protein
MMIPQQLGKHKMLLEERAVEPAEERVEQVELVAEPPTGLVVEVKLDRVAQEAAALDLAALDLAALDDPAQARAAQEHAADIMLTLNSHSLRLAAAMSAAKPAIYAAIAQRLPTVVQGLGTPYSLSEQRCAANHSGVTR